MNLNYQMDHIQYQILKIILSIFLKNIVKVLMIHRSKSLKAKIKITFKIRITFKIKNGYYLELSTPETMKLLGVLKVK